MRKIPVRTMSAICHGVKYTVTMLITSMNVLKSIKLSGVVLFESSTQFVNPSDTHMMDINASINRFFLKNHAIESVSITISELYKNTAGLVII